MDKSYAYRALETTAMINGVDLQNVIDEITAAIAEARKSSDNSAKAFWENLSDGDTVPTPQQLIEYITEQLVSPLSL